MKKVLAVVALAGFVSSGCTMKLAGEASVMKQWDRPAETTKTETVDTMRTTPAPVAPQQGSVGVVK